MLPLEPNPSRYQSGHSARAVTSSPPIHRGADGSQAGGGLPTSQLPIPTSAAKRVTEQSATAARARANRRGPASPRSPTSAAIGPQKPTGRTRR